MNEPVDFEGCVFQVGDYFISAQGRSGNMKLKRYQVLRIEEKKDWRDKPFFVIHSKPFRQYDWESDKPVRITKLDSCYILPVPSSGV